MLLPERERERERLEQDKRKCISPNYKLSYKRFVWIPTSRANALFLKVSNLDLPYEEFRNKTSLKPCSSALSILFVLYSQLDNKSTFNSIDQVEIGCVAKHFPLLSDLANISTESCFKSRYVECWWIYSTLISLTLRPAKGCRCGNSLQCVLGSHWA